VPNLAVAVPSIANIESASDVRRRVAVWAMALFSVTIFLGSSLLFLVQPMFAKVALPWLGGSPSVWNTCILFFQTTLLLGYLYAHLSTRWLGVRRQIYGHVILVLAPLVVLPLTAGGGPPPASANPVWWLLGTMTVRVGLPFFVVSTSAPLLQRWFATLPVPSARDPYFLYSASNLGSMIALLGYPFVLEPTVGTQRQMWLWSGGYLLLIALTAVCAVFVRAFAEPQHSAAASDDVIQSVPTSARRRIEWMVLSFIPSSLLLGVTTHISTDIAAVPLLWVLPLALYLATFVLTFAKREVVPHRWLVRGLPALILCCLLTMLLNFQMSWLIPLHVVTFFVVAMVCHRELAHRRPPAERLTEFYLWMSFGGMLGGVFNSLLAPQLFSGILEYPLLLAAAALARPSPAYRRSRADSWEVLVVLPAFVLLFWLGLWGIGALPSYVTIRSLLLPLAILLSLAYMAANRPQAFGAMALLFVCAIAFGRPSSSGTVLYAARSFFGVHRVVDAPDHTYHLLQHGSTTHGRQQMSTGDRCDPTGYYHPSSPIGQLIAARTGHLENVAVVGLGSGGMACYAESDRPWTFYEIDPLVEQIARNPRYFTYLQNSRGRLNVVLGDARVSLQRAAEKYDLIVLDAFSSDAIPIHLLTREAVRLYFSRLRPDGVVAVHISNRYLNLESIVAALAERDGLVSLANLDDRRSDAGAGKFASRWVMLARSDEPLSGLVGRPGWRSPRVDARVPAWTDDYSNIVQAFVR
jgi:predicted membrane-bound spermidine synthase